MNKREYDRSIQAGKEADEREARACTAVYDASTRRLVIELRSGIELRIPVALLQGLADATEEELAKVRVRPRGTAVYWEDLDVHLGVDALAHGIFGTRAWMHEIQSKGGQSKSEAKVGAARANGLKGGRPRKSEPAVKPLSKKPLAKITTPA